MISHAHLPPPPRFLNVQFNSLPTYRHARLSECLEQARFLYGGGLTGKFIALQVFKNQVLSHRFLNNANFSDNEKLWLANKR